MKGAEIELDARPVDGLQLTLNGNYNLARLTEDNPVATTGRKGDRIPYVPKWSGSASINYTTDLPGLGVEGSIGADASYQGAMATKFNSTISNYQQLDDYWLVGVHAGVKKDAWSVNLNVTNLLDDNTPINFNEIVPGVYPLGYYISRPRTVSLSAMIKF